MDAAAGPWGRFRDPLLERDYLRLCSRPSFFRNRCLAALGAGVVVLLAYAVAVGRDQQSLDTVGRSVHLTFSWLAAGLVFLAAASEAAVAIPTERATNTLVVLLTVPLSARRLAAGFLLSRLLFALTALLALIPIEGFALLLGGVSGGDLLRSLFTAFLAALYGSALGLLAGHAASTHRLALGRTLTYGLLHAVLLPALLASAAGLLGLYDESRGGTTNSTVDNLLKAAAGVFLSTPWGLLAANSGALPGPLGSLSNAVIYGAPVGITLLLTGLALWTAGRRLVLETESGIVAGTRKEAKAAAKAAVTRPRREVWKHPLLWKESRPPRSWWQRWSIRVMATLLFLAIAWLFLDPRVVEEFRSRRGLSPYDFFVSLPVWILALGFLPLSATLVAEEREKQAFDLLRAAPLSAREWFLARPLGLCWKAWPFFAGMALLTLYGVVTGLVHWLTPLCWGAGAVLVLPGMALLGFRLGLTAPTVRSANRRAGMVMAFLMVGYPMTVGCLFGFLSMAVRDFNITPLLFGLSPFVALASPFMILLQLLRDDEGGTRTAFAGIAGGALWFILGAWLWWRLPRMVADAFHGKGAG